MTASSLAFGIPLLSLSLSAADVHGGDEAQGSSVHHGQRRGERQSADPRLPQGGPRRTPTAPEFRAGPGLLRAPLKTKNFPSAL